MLNRLHIRNFTVFEDANFEFGPGLNVIVGTNGTGKSHVLKLGYAMESVYASVSRVALSNRSLWGESSNPQVSNSPLSPPIGLSVIKRLKEVFLLNDLGSLVHQPTLALDPYPWSQQESAFSTPDITGVQAFFGPGGASIIEFSLNSDGSLKIPAQLIAEEEIDNPVFIPPKEMLSLMPSIIGLSDKYAPLLDATYTDLARLLVTPLLRQPPNYAQTALTALNHVLNGAIVSSNGKFYFTTKGRSFEISIVAEGHRKLGTLTYLLTNGTLTPQATLFWDEPEANLNPALLKQMAAILAEMARAGFQIILATHSLFLMKELHILSQREKTPVRYFGLSAENGGATQVTMADTLTDLPNLVALDVEMAQSDAFLDVLNREDANL